MPLYTAIVDYNSCTYCGGSGIFESKECKECHNTWGTTNVIQVDAENLDVAIGKIKYKLFLDCGFEDNMLTSEDTMPIGDSVNIWYVDLLDKRDRFFMIYIIKTER